MAESVLDILKQILDGDDSTTGSTTQFSGTATTTPASVPGTAGGNILLVLIRCTPDQAKANRLRYQIDAGTTGTLTPGEFIGWPPKGGVTQITLDTASGTADYEVIMNRDV